MGLVNGSGIRKNDKIIFRVVEYDDYVPEVSVAEVVNGSKIFKNK